MYDVILKTALIISTTFGLILIGNITQAGETRSIELTDGSTVVGEVVSVIDGTYTVNTPKLGTITLKDADIRAITAKATGNPASTTTQPDASAANAGKAGEMADLQKRIMNDPSMAGSMTTLQNDPAFKQILQDPEIIKAIQSGDLNSLQSNPKIQNLTQNPSVQDIYKKLGTK
jgi:hypothetical protein